jgi:hypothetical protein
MTSMVRLGLWVIGCASAGLLLVGCARRPPAAEGKRDSVELGDLRESIIRQVGTASCSASSDCRTLPLGSKPCGGPRQYLVYSATATDSSRLAADAARYTSAEAKKNQEERQVSDCSVLVEPRVGCISGRCQAVDAGRRQAQ